MQYVAALAARWRALSAPVRTAAVALALAAGTCALFAGIVARVPQAQLFAAPLHAEQVAEVEERLADWNVPFTPVADNVVVDARRRSDLLLRLSLAGVPHAHLATTGEALAGVGALTPEAVIDAQTRVGLAGEIEAGLRGVDGVDDARVIVAPAKPAEFADESSRAASASVRLRTRAGAHLSRAAVAGMRAFVAAAVPGLAGENVTILDDGGIAPSGGAADGGDGADLARSLQAALDAAFGEGATIVAVHAQVRSGRSARRELRRAPVGPQAIESAARGESYGDGAKRYHRDDRSESRGSDTQELLSETPAGTIERVSSAVVVDRARGIGLQTVRELAAAAVGFDPRRGDTLSVDVADFARERPARKDPWWLLYGALVPLGPALVLALGAVVAARFAIPPLATALQTLVERAGAARAAKAVVGLEPSRVRGALAHEPPHAVAAVISALPAATAAAVLDLYPAHEREAIVRRMQRAHTPLLHDAGELLRRHV